MTRQAKGQAQASSSRSARVLRRLIGLFVSLNLVVLALVVVLTVTGGDDTDSVAADSGDRSIDEPRAEQTRTDAPTEPADDGPAEPAVDPAGDADPVARVEDVVAVSTDPPAYPDPFEPTANEVQPEAKRLGTMVAYLITNYEADSTVDDVLAALPTALEPAGIADQVRLVHHPGMWSRGTIEYAQNGGNLDGRISIIIVVRQEIGAEDSAEPERVETRTMEVRLARAEAGAWKFETLASAGGEPVERPADLSDRAAAVVDHDRIELPDTAAWDIYRGGIDEQLLQVMLDTAERSPFSVVVFQTGHAHNVYGTDRVSNHSVGRAVDIYRFGSQRVIDSHDPTSDLHALSEWVTSRYDIREYGSPWKFPDAVAHTFTNQVHQDHVHIGVYPYPTSPDPPPTTTGPPSDQAG